MQLLECGIIVNTHGIRGEVKVKSYLDEGMFEQLEDIFVAGKPCKLISARPHKGHMLVVLEGVDSVEKAMALKTCLITVDRGSLNLPQGHYFYSDIYGFQVFDRRVNRVVGNLAEVRESPAGMMYIIDSSEGTFMVPDVDAFRRGIDFSARRIDIETIQGMLPDEN